MNKEGPQGKPGDHPRDGGGMEEEDYKLTFNVIVYHTV
jgi:hypothetical protein